MFFTRQIFISLSVFFSFLGASHGSSIMGEMHDSREMPEVPEVGENRDPLHPPEWLGRWHYVRYIYQGQENPNLNPNLLVTFEFKADGTDILRWYRRNEEGFCERRGEWRFDTGFFIDKVTWVNPRNASECSLDQDMHQDHVSSTPARIAREELWLYMSMGGDEFTMIWEHVKAPQNRAIPRRQVRVSRFDYAAHWSRESSLPPLPR
ncbi:MAG: hypothetical protein C5B49_14405 [Bdellovibrio sp.]|nr:MAG: hypothetical protein C5B49_14405 [Bdellovibrio sp.]